jgi:hypothetical protein
VLVNRAPRRIARLRERPVVLRDQLVYQQRRAPRSSESNIPTRQAPRHFDPALAPSRHPLQDPVLCPPRRPNDAPVLSSSKSSSRTGRPPDASVRRVPTGACAKCTTRPQRIRRLM